MVCCECVVSVCVFSLTLISLSSMEDPWPRTSRRPVGNDSMEACTTRRLTPACARESVHNPGPQGSPLPQGSTLGSQDPQVQQCTDTPSAAMQRVPQAPAARLGAGCRETGRDGVDSLHYMVTEVGTVCRVDTLCNVKMCTEDKINCTDITHESGIQNPTVSDPELDAGLTGNPISDLKTRAARYGGNMASVNP